VTSKNICPQTTTRLGAVGRECDYLAEVEESVGDEERAFEATIQQPMAQTYSEVLSSEAAPIFQRTAPRTLLSEALSRPDAPWCRKARHAEMGALAAKEVMTLIMMALPVDKKATTLQWEFPDKLHPDGGIERYKARLVAKGIMQRAGRLFEHWALTERLPAYCALLAHVAYFCQDVKFLDVTTAFLNGPLDEETCIIHPSGFEDGTRRVMCLSRALYGLQQAEVCLAKGVCQCNANV
jgi:hypothetical protein